MQQPTYRCFSKALAEEKPGEIIRSEKWIAARRNWLNIFEDRVICGDWDVPFSIASDIVVYTGWSFPFPVKVLEIVVGGKAYQFGINGWCRPERHLPQRTRKESVKLKYSPFSIAVRIGAVAAILYWLWETLTG